MHSDHLAPRYWTLAPKGANPLTLAASTHQIIVNKKCENAKGGEFRAKEIDFQVSALVCSTEQIHYMASSSEFVSQAGHPPSFAPG
jgi:hypothetical protein